MSATTEPPAVPEALNYEAEVHAMRLARRQDAIFASIARMGGEPYLLTQSGAVVPLDENMRDRRAIVRGDPRNDVFRMDDVVHALARTNRFGGALERYSVAEHSLLMAKWLFANLASVPPRAEHAAVAWDALWHDAPEAYMNDIPKPVKTKLAEMADERTAYSVIDFEDRIMARIAWRFGCMAGTPLVVQADARIVIDEVLTLAPPVIADPRMWVSRDALRAGRLGVMPRGVTPKTAERDFVAFAAELIVLLEGNAALAALEAWTDARTRRPDLFVDLDEPQLAGLEHPEPPPEWVGGAAVEPAADVSDAAVIEAMADFVVDPVGVFPPGVTVEVQATPRGWAAFAADRTDAPLAV